MTEFIISNFLVINESFIICHVSGRIPFREIDYQYFVFFSW